MIPRAFLICIFSMKMIRRRERQTERKRKKQQPTIWGYQHCSIVVNLSRLENGKVAPAGLKWRPPPLSVILILAESARYWSVHALCGAAGRGFPTFRTIFSYSPLFIFLQGFFSIFHFNERREGNPVLFLLGFAVGHTLPFSSSTLPLSLMANIIHPIVQLIKLVCMLSNILKVFFFLIVFVNSKRKSSKL